MLVLKNMWELASKFLVLADEIENVFFCNKKYWTAAQSQVLVTCSCDKFQDLQIQEVRLPLCCMWDHFHCEVKQWSCLILELMEKAEAEAAPTAPAAAAVPPGDVERDACSCGRGRVWSSRSYWQLILVVKSWVCAAHDEPFYFNRWYATLTFIAIKYS